MIETFLKYCTQLYVTYIVPIKHMQERAKEWVYSWNLSKTNYTIYYMDYIPVSKSLHSEIYEQLEVLRVYDIQNGIPWSQKRLGRLYGYLGISYWNHKKQKKDFLVLHTDHLQAGLHTTDLSILWAYSEEGILELLEDYVHKHRHNSLEMIDMFLNKRHVYPEIKYLLPSISLPKNLTPIILSMFYDRNMYKKEEDIVFTYYDDNLVEHTIKNNGYIYS